MQKLNLKTSIGVVAGLAVIALFFWYGLPGAEIPQTADSQSASQDEAELASVQSAFESLSSSDSDFVAKSGVKVYELTAGTGTEVVKDKSVAVHYVARFQNGMQFDSSVDRGQPLSFVYGQNQLIPGFEAGLAGARAGSVRRIIVPPELGYGKAGVVAEDGTVIIPRDSTLVFDIFVVSVEE